ncbi:peptide ABC transporter substrate-binding protein [Polyangium aurulentum]|uniref:peptide ABC transporter substrate-binding protein n=1 Tax=Polyangium aurulentum TaxID=2567896 RepID=UPI0010AEBAC7|nr:peptide ABC transporter substrate-binding protein [Polyangium aurulentum]UQA61166.1 peptide ABC transporter substrate-binding protein [Polyangium aurulentum]
MAGKPLLPLVVVISVLGGACTDERASPSFGPQTRSGKDPHTLYVDAAGEPEELDPGRSRETKSRTLIAQLFEGLSAFGPEDGRIVQGVATRWEQSADNRVFRFHLRPEARWSDGVPVTAHDFVYAWKRVLDPAFASPAADHLFVLRNGEAFHRGDGSAAVGVRALDDLTLEVELERPTPYFLQLTAMPVTYPVRRDVIERLAREGRAERWVRPEHIVVNGPYTLDAWKFRYEITMKRNPHYWAAGELRIHRVVWAEVENRHAAMNLYKTGDLDWTGDSGTLPVEWLETLEGKRDFRRFPLLSTYWYELNTARPPLDDVRVRRALDLAVDKRTLAATVARGGIPATHYVPEIIGGGYAERVKRDRAAGRDWFDMPNHGFDPERARSLLREAGHSIVQGPDGQLLAEGFPPVELLFEASESARQFAVAVQDMWRRHLGITVALRSEEWRVLLQDLRAKRFQIVRYGWAADYDHPHSFLATFVTGSPQNHTGWSDPELDALVARAAATADAQESIELYRRAEERAVAGMCRIPFYFYTGTTLVKPWVQGWAPNGMGIHLVRWLSLEGSGPSPRPFPPPGKVAGP